MKTEVVTAYFSGITISELSKQYGIVRITLYSWVNESQTKKQPDKKLNMRDYFDLKQKCEKQAAIIEILQNAPCTTSSSLRKRYSYIQLASEQYSVNLLCKAIKVAKGSYYNHIFRNKNENTVYAQRKAELAHIIEEIFHENNQIFGASKIHAILKDRGYKVAQSTVAYIMHEKGLFAVGTSAKTIYLMNQERKQNMKSNTKGLDFTKQN